MKYIFSILLLFSVVGISFSQCKIITNERNDGNTIKYFTPVPIVRQAGYEVGVSIYKNETTNIFMLNVSVLFKTMNPQKLSGNLIIQTINTKGISLEPLVSELIVMNNRDVAIGLYKIEPEDYNEITKYKLKNVFFYINNDLIGNTIYENSSILISQLACF